MLLETLRIRLGCCPQKARGWAVGQRFRASFRASYVGVCKLVCGLGEGLIGLTAKKTVRTGKCRSGNSAPACRPASAAVAKQTGAFSRSPPKTSFSSFVLRKRTDLKKKEASKLGKRSRTTGCIRGGPPAVRGHVVCGGGNVRFLYGNSAMPKKTKTHKGDEPLNDQGTKST